MFKAPFVIIAFACQALGPSNARAAGAAPIELLNACAFAVLAGANIGNGNASNVSGDVGSATQSGFGTLTVSGTNHFNDATTTAAQGSLSSAYADGSTRVVTTTLPTELGGRVQGPGVFRADSGTFSLGGVLTLDGEDDAGAVFIFKTDSTLITAAGSSVNLSRGAQAQNVFWVVGSSASLGASSTFRGSILANTAITLGASVTVHGRLLAKDADVVLDSDQVVNDFPCASPTPTVSPTPTHSPTPASSPSPTHTPDPASAGPQAPPETLQLRLSHNAFYPRRQSLYISGTTASSGLLELEVYDLAGHRVRRLLSQQRSEGPWAAQWDGRDDLGKEVNSDIYLILYRHGAAHELKKTALLRD